MLPSEDSQYDSETVDVMLGNLTQETNDAGGVWEQIGANWATQRTLLEESKDQY